MRRPALIVSIALAAGALAIRWRRRRAASSALAGVAPAPPLSRPTPLLPAPTSPPPASATRFVSVPWELLAAPADEASLTIRYRGDEHMELDRIDAQETPTQLFVTVLMRWRPPEGGWFAFADEHEAVVPLAQPLGGRELVHAPVDEPSGPPLYP
ncbi:MAG TPA: hypothetical protein VFS37_12490 [Conexibacter sp.]|nr:hypothetical protein [Conexibacter sp.]